MLAKLHLAGANAHHLPIKTEKAKRYDTKFLTNAKQILEIIRRQKTKTDFDRLAQEVLTLKISLAEQFTTSKQEDFHEYIRANLPLNHVTHGDYHDGNLFFDEQNRVSHIFDWEKVMKASRAREIVRAVLFMCLASPDGYRTSFTEHTFRQANLFLHSYHAWYPLKRAEIEAAVYQRYINEIHSLWVESEHYLLHNSRVDVFLESGYSRLLYFSQHLDSTIEQLCDGLPS